MSLQQQHLGASLYSRYFRAGPKYFDCRALLQVHFPSSGSFRPLPHCGRSEVGSYSEPHHACSCSPGASSSHHFNFPGRWCCLGGEFRAQMIEGAGWTPRPLLALTVPSKCCPQLAVTLLGTFIFAWWQLTGKARQWLQLFLPGTAIVS